MSKSQPIKIGITGKNLINGMDDLNHILNCIIYYYRPCSKKLAVVRPIKLVSGWLSINNKIYILI